MRSLLRAIQPSVIEDPKDYKMPSLVRLATQQ